ncbi:uncharacterized protein LOC100891468 isoform X2 [Strongylocentrotus purpuratus]|uniref:Transmembrane protein n=1 Tax=Strongylocentrotus purpuratus TaxID=7668 RepID=A0A7M7T2E6_STRPU|nr:uncharacterized protein LOC100891468 isoform X2 [Strongylocentrotus purpuratus]
MQPVTIMENRPSRAGYSENNRAGAATCTAVFMIVYAIGSAVCGAIDFVPRGVSSISLFQIFAFAQGGLYLLTALFGLGTICRYTCMIAFFLMACILSAFASLGALGCYCYLIYIFVVFGSFENCQEACLYHTVPVCVLALLSIMAFISALVGSIYCFIGGNPAPYCVRPASSKSKGLRLLSTTNKLNVPP